AISAFRERLHERGRLALIAQAFADLEDIFPNTLGIYVRAGPMRFQQFVRRDETIVVLHEITKNIESFRGQWDALAVSPQSVIRGVEAERFKYFQDRFSVAWNPKDEAHSIVAALIAPRAPIRSLYSLRIRPAAPTKIEPKRLAAVTDPSLGTHMLRTVAGLPGGNRPQLNQGEGFEKTQSGSDPGGRQRHGIRSKSYNRPLEPDRRN